MPAAIVAKLNAEIVKAVQTAGVKGRLSRLGRTAVLDTPEQMTTFVTAEVEKQGKAAKATGAQVD